MSSEIVYAEPFQMARRLKGGKALTLFESAQRHEHLGRYSFVAVDPSQSLEVRQGVTYFDDRKRREDPLDLLQMLLRRERRQKLAGLPPFQGDGLAMFLTISDASLNPRRRSRIFLRSAPTW